MDKETVLIADETDPLLVQGLQDLGFEVVEKPGIGTEEAYFMLPDLSGIIVNSRIRFTRQVFEKCARLRFIGRLGSGREIIDLQAARDFGVEVHFSPEGNAPAVGEHALALLLAALKHVVRAHTELREGVWRREENRGGEIQGKTVGIWGFGHTGRAFARLLGGFGCKILAYDKYAAVDCFAEAASPEQIFREADLVSLHLPLTEETRLLANRDFFGSFCKPIVFLNTARGEIVDSEALVESLEAGKVRAAGLDVFESEPPWKSVDFLPAWRRLLSFEQVVMSPHIGGWTRESKQRMATVLLERITEQLKKRDVK